VTIQTVHVVGISANMIWVTAQGAQCEHVHQFEMFAILKYVVIKPWICGLISRQLTLQCFSVCTQIVVGGLIDYHLSMKCIQWCST